MTFGTPLVARFCKFPAYPVTHLLTNGNGNGKNGCVQCKNGFVVRVGDCRTGFCVRIAAYSL